MKNIISSIVAFFIIVIPFFLQAQNQRIQNNYPDTPFNFAKDKYVKDSSFFSLGNTFGQSWFKNKIYNVHQRNEAGNILTASDYELDTLSNLWYEQRRYEGVYINQTIRKSWLSFVYDKDNGNWRMSDSIIFNIHGSPTISWYKLWNPISKKFDSGKLTDYFYNDEGVLHLSFNKYYDTISTGWKKDYYEVIHYNQYDLDSIRGFYKWNFATQDWTDSLIISYTYNGNQLLDEEIRQLWVSDVWQNYKKWEYIYNPQNRVDEQYEYLWSEFSDGWEYKEFSEFDYYSNQLLKSITDLLWDGSEWFNKTRVNYSYFENGLSQEIQYEYWSFGYSEWTKASRNTYEYDENNNKKKYVFYIWDEDNSQWKNFYKEESFWSYFESQSVIDNNPVIFNLFPNPASDQVSIIMDDRFQNNKNNYLYIYSQDGRFISGKQLTCGSEVIDVSNLPDGSYLFVLSTGKDVNTKLVIVK